MTPLNAPRRPAQIVRHDSEPHLYAVGQIVRLKPGFVAQPNAASLYRVVATLPPNVGVPQYRIQSDAERHERVASQDRLEAVSTSGASLSERTFDHG